MKIEIKNQKPKRRRRFLKFLLWFFGVLVFLFVAINVAVRVFLPEKKVRALIAEQVLKNTGRSFSIDRLSWSLLGSLDAEGVRVGFTPAEQMPDSAFISLDEARVRFKLMPILRRRFEVSEVSLIRPRLSLTPLSFVPPDTTSRSGPTGAGQDTAPPAVQPLPVTVDLSRFSLQNFDLKIALPDTIRNPEVTLTNLNVDLRDLVVPKGFPGSLDGAKGSLRLFTDQSRLRYRDKEIELVYRPDLEWAFGIADSLWDVKGTALLTRPDQNQADLSMQIQGRGGGLGDWIQIDTATLDVGGQRFVDVTGRAETVATKPTFRMIFGGADVDLARVQDFVSGLLPPAFSEQLKMFSIAGRWRPLVGEVSGDLESMKIDLKTTATACSFSQTPNLVSADSIDLNATFRGVWQPAGLKDGQVEGDVSVGAIHVNPNDTTTILIQDVTLGLKSALNKLFMPVKGEAEGRVPNVLGGNADLRFDWQADSLPDYSFLSARLQFNLNGLDLAALPLPDPVVRGRLSASLAGTADGLDGIRLDWEATTSGLTLIQPAEEFIVPDMTLRSLWRLAVSPDFLRISLNDASFQIDSLFAAKAFGEVNLADSSFGVTVAEMTVRNKAIAPHLPESIQNLMQDFSVTGTETASLTVAGFLRPDTVTADIAGDVSLNSVEFTDYRQDMRLKNIQGEMRFRGTPIHIDADGSILLGSLEYPLVLQVPVQDSRFDFEAMWDQPAFLRIHKGTLRIPSLGGGAEMQFAMAQADSSLEMGGTLYCYFNSSQWVSPVQNLGVRGHVSAALTLATQDAIRRHIRISGTLEMVELNLQQQDVFQVSNIHGRVPVQIDLDLVQGKLLGDPRYRPPGSMEYENRRDWIAATSPAVGNFGIDSISVAGYSLHDLVMDLDMRRGWIQIPRFDVHLFDGSIGGSLWIDPGDGTPEKIRYGIEAQASRINSAALLRDQTAKTSTELNANLSFTGVGVIPEKGMDVTGYFHITQIGPQFASTLLRGMDPQGSDRSIRMTRRLLDMGWKPKLFSFELRHGHVYPSLTLSQPWFTPIRIPGRLELGRLPLAFFLTTKSFNARE